MPSKNPFAYKAKQQGKKKSSGKRVGKSKPEKANNQLNRRVKWEKVAIIRYVGRPEWAYSIGFPFSPFTLLQVVQIAES